MMSIREIAETIIDERMSSRERNEYIRTMYQMNMHEGYMLVDFEDDIEHELNKILEGGE